ncbi:MAG: sulfite oxidase-like oxidoreductase [Elusimicrobiota bacterium]
MDLGLSKKINPQDWQLEICGLIEKPLKLSWKELNALKMISIKADIHCVTTWSITDSQWHGVSCMEIIKLCSPLKSAQFVLASSYDGYDTNIPISFFSAADSMLALFYSGKELPHHYGGPVRLLIPSLYFWKSAKWLKKLEFLKDDRKGYWEQRGYHSRGNPWEEERLEG